MWHYHIDGHARRALTGRPSAEDNAMPPSTSSWTLSGLVSLVALSALGCGSNPGSPISGMGDGGSSDGTLDEGDATATGGNADGSHVATNGDAGGNDTSTPGSG